MARTPPKAPGSRKRTGAATTSKEVAKIPRRPYATKHNWPEAERLFVEGDTKEDGSIVILNMKQIAERLDIPHEQVRRRSVQFRWPDKRQRFQTEQAKERQKQRIQKLAGDAIEFDNNAYNTAKVGLALVAGRLSEIAKEVRAKETRRRAALEALEAGDPVEKWELWSAVNYKELEGLASAADRFQQIGMRALGTDVQKHEISNPDGSLAPQVNIHAEITRDDPQRLFEFLQAAANSDLLERMFEQQAAIEGEAIEDAEEVEDESA